MSLHTTTKNVPAFALSLDTFNVYKQMLYQQNVCLTAYANVNARGFSMR